MAERILTEELEQAFNNAGVKGIGLLPGDQLLDSYIKEVEQNRHEKPDTKEQSNSNS